MAWINGKDSSSRSGQALLESFFTTFVICLLFFGLLQVALVLNSKEVLHHAAARAARSQSVGFNTWMAHKSARVAAIPNSGRLLEPVVEENARFLDDSKTLGENWDDAIDTDRRLPALERNVVEMARIPEYLASENHERAEWILNYEEWQSGNISVHLSENVGITHGTIASEVTQRYPLAMPFHRLFYAPPADGSGTDRITLKGNAEVVAHYPEYLE